MSELERNEREINEIRTKIVTFSIALGLLNGLLTTDNKSPSNELSGLDSTCIYFAHAVGLSPEELKGRVLDEYRDYKPNELDSTLEDYETENDCSEPDNRPVEASEESKDFEIRGIALMIRLGLVADDSKSELNDLSPLEQLTTFLLSPKNQNELKDYKKKVKGAYIDLAGGYYVIPGIFGTQVTLNLGDDATETI